MGLDEAVDLAITRTRQFAVRQERWFRRDPRIVWLDATDAAESGGGGAEPAGRLVVMHLSKHHGLGNDFLVLLRDDVVPMPDDVAAALARRLCHRTRGIGADGLLIGGPPVRRIACDLQMWLYNADGSRAEMSGNGIRCLAQAVLRDRGSTEATLAISTDGGLRRVDIEGRRVRRRGVGERRHGRDERRSTRRTAGTCSTSIRCGPWRTSRSATRTPSSSSTTPTRSISSLPAAPSLT